MESDFERMLEDKYILDFERSGQVRARRNALLANWISTRTKRNDIAALTTGVLHAAATESGDAAFCDRLMSDLGKWGIVVDETELRNAARTLLMDAVRQLASEDGAAAL